MNDKQRNEIDESELALQTARVLESGECSDQADAATYELGRLLRQSATHDLPESNDDLRQQLLASLATNGDAPSDAPLVSAKALLDTMPARTISRRWWMGLAAGALVAAGGWWLYQSDLSRSRIALNNARQVGLQAHSYENISERFDSFAPLSKSTADVSRPRVQRWNGQQQAAQSAAETGTPVTSSRGMAKLGLLVNEAREGKDRSLRIKNDKGVEKSLLPTEGEEAGAQEYFQRLPAKQYSDTKKKPAADRLSGMDSDGDGVADSPWIPLPATPQEEPAPMADAFKSKMAKAEVGQSLSQRHQSVRLNELSSSLPSSGEVGGDENQIAQRDRSADKSKRENVGGGGRGPTSSLGSTSKALPPKGQSAMNRSFGNGNDESSGVTGDVVGGAVIVMSDGTLQGLGRKVFSQNGVGLPPISPTRTSTVVPVPDGGTVLLGGVKRKSNVTPLYLIESQDQDNLDLQFSESNFSSRLKDDSSGEQYAPIYENAFVQATGGAALSTFSIDVDTASYANMRRFLNSGQTPPRDSIRIEELVNYFKYDYPQPKGDDPFSVNMELAGCPWNDSHKLLRVGLKGKDVHVKERPATNVVFLIDVSGSMNSAKKLPLLKRGFQMMVKQLGENDRVSIVTYAGNAGVALEPTTGDNSKTINEAIERLTPGGSTHGSAGINLAYKLAQQHFITGGVNKVILATDGDLNVGVTADGALVDLIKQKASEGVFLTVLGFGTGNLQDGKLEKLADNGNGHYAYIDSNREAHRVLVQQLSGSLVTIAKDVKIQIEFNPAEVKSYRLVGYENRMLETKDFADDRKDAGEIGAGHTVTAIYEIEPTGGVAAAFVAPQGMKYQDSGTEAAPPKEDSQRAKLSDAAESGELATVALRYKQPDENTSKRIEFAIKNQEKSFTSASDDFRFAASVAGFGMLLRDSAHSGSASPQMILEMASQSMGDDTTGYRAEFVDLIRKAFAR